MRRRNQEHPFQRMDTLGMRPRTWGRLLSGIRNPVDLGFEHRLVGALAVSVANSAGARIRRSTERAPLPLADDIDVTFIIGHWRSGTTFLHHLLAASPRFATLPTSMAVFPELHGTPLLMPVLHTLGIGKPYRRLIDNVMLSPDTPMELEFAVLNLTGLSEYLSVSFPRARHEFLRYLRANPGDCTPAEDAAWRAAVVETTARVARTGRTVLHKNPPSTANVLELKALFPRAQFVFLHREPVGVFRSTLNTWRVLTEAGTLQWGGDSGLEDYLIQRYLRLHEAYLAQRDQLPPGDLVELSFEELQADPMAAARRIHVALDWAPIDAEAHQRYLDGVSAYSRGGYPDPEARWLERAREAWTPIRERLARR